MNLKYYETDFWIVILGDNQAYLGYSLIDLKRTASSLSELTEEEWKDLQSLIKKLENLYKEVFNATMFNWTCLMNNAYKEDLPKPHVHLHFRPRYKNSVELGGNIFIDKDFGHHYNRDRKFFPETNLKKLIIQKLQKSL